MCMLSCWTWKHRTRKHKTSILSMGPHCCLLYKASCQCFSNQSTITTTTQLVTAQQVWLTEIVENQGTWIPRVLTTLFWWKVNHLTLMLSLLRRISNHWPSHKVPLINQLLSKAELLPSILMMVVCWCHIQCKLVTFMAFKYEGRWAKFGSVLTSKEGISSRWL